MATIADYVMKLAEVVTLLIIQINENLKLSKEAQVYRAWFADNGQVDPVALQASLAVARAQSQFQPT